MDFPTRIIESNTANDGGTGLYTRKATKDSWKNWGFRFQVLSPTVGWVQHSFPIIDDTHIPSREDGSKPTWAFVPCLGTPTDQSSPTIDLDPEGVVRCRQLIIPGTNTSLHECDHIVDGNKSGFTSYLYRCLILNWTSQTVQILDLKTSAWERLFMGVEELRKTYGEKFNVLNYTFEAKCVPLQGAAPYRYDLGLISDPHGHKGPDDIKQWLNSNKENREQYELAQRSLIPAKTPEEVSRMIGATAPPQPMKAEAEAAGGNVFTSASLDSVEDIFAGPSTGTASRL